MSESLISWLAPTAGVLIIAVLIVASILRKRTRTISELKTIIRILYSMDDKIPQKYIHCNSLGTYQENRYLPMALYLEKTGAFQGFVEHDAHPSVFSLQAGASLQNQYLGWNPMGRLLEGVLDNDNEPGQRLYKNLQKLDDLVNERLPKELFKSNPSKVYFLKLNFLEAYCRAALEGQWLTYDATLSAQGTENTQHFLNSILNEFYKNHSGYVRQEEKYESATLIKEIVED